MRLLLALLLAFAFVSSEASVLLQLDQLRTAAFVATLAGLLGLGLARAPRLVLTETTVPALLLGLLAVVLAADAVLSKVDPLDYKVALLLPVLVLAPTVATAFGDRDPSELVWRLLALYVIATAILAVVAVPEWLVRGRADLTRFDFTGSLIGHTGLCVVFLITTLARLRPAAGHPALLVHVALAGTATVMVLLTGTRTALATFVLYLILEVAGAAAPRAAVARLVPLAFGALAALTLHTLLVSDDFLERLLGGSSEDWSSGRFASQVHWLTRGLEHPLGLGFGAVRETLRDGRPALDGVRLLEWPHNEPIRFLVEAGLPGLAFVGLLLGRITVLAVRAARLDRSGPRRAMVLAIAADMLGQSLFQNYFNSIYHAGALLFVLSILVARIEAEVADEPATAPAGVAPDLPEATAAT